MQNYRKIWLAKKNKVHYIIITAVLFCAGFLYFQMFFNQHSEESHAYVEFKKKLTEVCSNPLLPHLEYNGVESFFNFLSNPDDSYCYSWLEFGGEKIAIPTQNDADCLDEIRKSKFICFNEEYEMTKDPCLVYSFTMDKDQQFERDMHMFSCDVHVFDANQVKISEHIRRTEFWFEHGWDIAEFQYDLPDEKTDRVIRRRSLDYMSHTLNHEGKVLKLIKSDVEGREWILLKQIISHYNIIDVQQIAVRIHLPVQNNMTGTARHEIYRELFEVFQGLNCLGYKYIMYRPAPYYRGSVKIPEMNKTFYHAYEVNFAKVLKTKS